MLDGVYRNSEGVPVFHEVAAPTLEELQALLAKIITRIMRLLTRQGFLIEEQDRTYLAETATGQVLTPLQAASCTYRIALGPRAGQKVLSLQSLPSPDKSSTPDLCAKLHGFTLHAAVSWRADQRKELEHLCRYITRRRCRVATEEHIQRRHHPYRHVAAGIHAAPRRPGALSALTSDPLPWRARTECEVAF